MPKERYASSPFEKNPYKCSSSWPEDCFVQCGNSGLVLESGNLKEVFETADPIGAMRDITAYTTAYFEAFPRDVIQGDAIFIRGEGKTITAAERAAWDKYTRYKACERHEYERRGYKNGGGFCVLCGMLFHSKAFEPVIKCGRINIKN